MMNRDFILKNAAKMKVFLAFFIGISVAFAVRFLFVLVAKFAKLFIVLGIFIGPVILKIWAISVLGLVIALAMRPTNGVAELPGAGMARAAVNLMDGYDDTAGLQYSDVAQTRSGMANLRDVDVLNPRKDAETEVYAADLPEVGEASDVASSPTAGADVANAYTEDSADVASLPTEDAVNFDITVGAMNADDIKAGGLHAEASDVVMERPFDFKCNMDGLRAVNAIKARAGVVKARARILNEAKKNASIRFKARASAKVVNDQVYGVAACAMNFLDINISAEGLPGSAVSAANVINAVPGVKSDKSISIFGRIKAKMENFRFRAKVALHNVQKLAKRAWCSFAKTMTGLALKVVGLFAALLIGLFGSLAARGWAVLMAKAKDGMISARVLMMINAIGLLVSLVAMILIALSASNRARKMLKKIIVKFEKTKEKIVLTTKIAKFKAAKPDSKKNIGFLVGFMRLVIIIEKSIFWADVVSSIVFDILKRIVVFFAAIARMLAIIIVKSIIEIIHIAKIIAAIAAKLKTKIQIAMRVAKIIAEKTKVFMRGVKLVAKCAMVTLRILFCFVFIFLSGCGNGIDMDTTDCVGSSVTDKETKLTINGGHRGWVDTGLEVNADTSFTVAANGLINLCQNNKRRYEVPAVVCADRNMSAPTYPTRASDIFKEETACSGHSGAFNDTNKYISTSINTEPGDILIFSPVMKKKAISNCSNIPSGISTGGNVTDKDGTTRSFDYVCNNGYVTQVLNKDVEVPAILGQEFFYAMNNTMGPRGNKVALSGNSPPPPYTHRVPKMVPDTDKIDKFDKYFDRLPDSAGISQKYKSDSILATTLSKMQPSETEFKYESVNEVFVQGHAQIRTATRKFYFKDMDRIVDLKADAIAEGITNPQVISAIDALKKFIYNYYDDAEIKDKEHSKVKILNNIDVFNSNAILFSNPNYPWVYCYFHKTTGNITDYQYFYRFHYLKNVKIKFRDDPVKKTIVQREADVLREIAKVKALIVSNATKTVYESQPTPLLPLYNFLLKGSDIDLRLGSNSLRGFNCSNTSGSNSRYAAFSTYDLNKFCNKICSSGNTGCVYTIEGPSGPKDSTMFDSNLSPITIAPKLMAKVGGGNGYGDTGEQCLPNGALNTKCSAYYNSNFESSALRMHHPYEIKKAGNLKLMILDSEHEYHDNYGGYYIQVEQRCLRVDGQGLYAYVSPTTPTNDPGDSDTMDVSVAQKGYQPPRKGRLYLGLKNSHISQNSSLVNSGAYDIKIVSSIEYPMVSAMVDFLLLQGPLKLLHGAKDVNGVSSGGAGRLMYTNIVQNVSFVSFAQAAMTLAITFYVFSYFFGVSGQSGYELLIFVFRLAIVAVLISKNSWDFFNVHLFTAFINGANELVNVYSNTTNGTNPFAAFDKTFGLFTATTTWERFLSIFLSMGFIGVATLALFMIAFFEFIKALVKAFVLYTTSFVGIGLMIGMAPIFILSMLFGKTRTLFEAWLKMLVSYVMQPLFFFIFLIPMANMIVNFLSELVTFNACEGCIFGYTFKVWFIPIPVCFFRFFIPVGLVAKLPAVSSAYDHPGIMFRGGSFDFGDLPFELYTLIALFIVTKCIPIFASVSQTMAASMIGFLPSSQNLGKVVGGVMGSASSILGTSKEAKNKFKRAASMMKEHGKEMAGEAKSIRKRAEGVMERKGEKGDKDKKTGGRDLGIKDSEKK